MARVLGNASVNPIKSANDIFEYKANKSDYRGIRLSTGVGVYLKQYSIHSFYMTKEEVLVSESPQISANRLFRGYNFFNTTVTDIAFSADKVYCVLIVWPNLLFFKLAADGKYDYMASQPTSSISIDYVCDITEDGQFAAGTSASSPYIEFYKRTGDTWEKLNAITGTLQTSNSATKNRIFDKFNLAHAINNFSSGINFQTFQYNPTSNVFEVSTTTGLGALPNNGGLDWVWDGTQYYFASTDLASPYITLYKTTDGLNFTDLSSNIAGKPSYQHWSCGWDPSGTYLLVYINNASHAFGIYKRDGDNLNYLGPTAFDELPISALVTTRYHISWSKDSKYVMICSGSGTSSPYGSWMYRRSGDNFYRIQAPDYYNNVTLFDEGVNWLTDGGTPGDLRTIWL